MARIKTFDWPTLIRDVVLVGDADDPVRSAASAAQGACGQVDSPAAGTSGRHTRYSLDEETLFATGGLLPEVPPYTEQKVDLEVPLVHASRETAEATGRRSWARPGLGEKHTAGQKMDEETN